MNDTYENEKPNILIVDDVSANLVILSEMVKETNCVPRAVISVKQAQAAIRKKKPQLILLDISMPDINGFEFCQQLKENPKTREIPIIFISALNKTDDKIKGFQLGAVDYISKPFEKDEVTLRVNTHLKMYEMQKELEKYNRRLSKMVIEQTEKIVESQKTIVHTVADIVESRENPDDRHLNNICRNARKLAMALSFSRKFEDAINENFIEQIEIAAGMHDIGKAAIPDRILLKPGILTEAERKVMMKHTRIGAEYIRKMHKETDKNDFMEMSVQIAMSHHERWDGNGYPDNLCGDKIPLAARIVAVVDVFDALVGKRCYKPAYSLDESIQLMQDETGKHFDPDIMDVFLKIYKRLAI